MSAKNWLLIAATIAVLGPWWCQARDAGGAAHCRSPYLAAVVVDAANGKVMLSDGADRECYPASCTKLMTAHLALKAIRSGKLSFSERICQSKRSAQEAPSCLGLKPGQSITVRHALEALMVKSANDVAVMIAERLAGSVEAFVAEMNYEAHRLGMTNTVYVTPNGYPPPKGSTRGFDRSTAADLAILACRILDEEPEITALTSLKEITIPEVVDRLGNPEVMKNHNNLLVGCRKSGVESLPFVDGLKTGFHRAGGCSIVLTGAKNGHRAVVVVVGSSSAQERDRNAGRLLSDALDALGH